MQMLRQEFCAHDNRRGEQGPQEKTQQSDCDGGDDELGDEPEDELEAHGDEEVDGHGEALAEAFGHEAEEDATDGHAGPETDDADAGGEGRCGADAKHEGYDPAAEGH